ncbi:DUF3871 family protein [Lacihabitans soyangensis]|uniref:DUF3871 family protein n=1 Tax=Lacihabitans soyangensis TaxID=869394 RepID=A0AAE3H150_9BACT|nr:DUF3871 family protein [Lacihabitans soyangensis]MCP9762988.1 DUF3871 family protein [Lacihabitans soyangensis]
MELQLINPEIKLSESVSSSELAFIQANTIPMALYELEQKHIIPVFVKDNEPVISHHDFIGCVQEVASHVFKNETILPPSLRVSHPIKGRIPEAKEKSAKDLLEHEKTIYYERMAFVIEIPSVYSEINGNRLSLTVGGIKAYNMDNLYNRKGADEHFKIFIGFQNKVCCNLCIWTDGFSGVLKVKSSSDLMKQIFEVFTTYSFEQHFSFLNRFKEYYLTENQFANLLGRAKMYQYLPLQEKKMLPNLMFGDNQIGIVARDYYQDESFCRNPDGSVNLWNLYNLFTGANKQSYIDTFLDRGLNAFSFVKHLENSLERGSNTWFLS